MKKVNQITSRTMYSNRMWNDPADTGTRPQTVDG